MRSLKRKLGVVAIACVAALTVSGCLSSGSGGDDASQASPPPPVQNQNTPPAIQGTPAEAVSANSYYLFEPTASDADGDTLTFTIENKPEWLSFDASSGSISGTPAEQDVGYTSNVKIGVSDGQTTVYLPSFDIEVVAAGSLATTLTWNPPTENADGSALTDLAGYKIYYGLNPGFMTSSVNLDNPGLSAYTVENLTANTYYFSAKAVNSSGIESDLSNIVVRQIL